MTTSDERDPLEARVQALDPARRRLLEGMLEAAGGATSAGSAARASAPARRLVGYVVGRGEAAPAVPDLRAHLEARLPEHMVPQQLVVLEALPRTRGGKVDRATLATLSTPTVAQVPEADAAPVEVTQEADDDIVASLCAIWAEVLDLSEVGAHEDFFELGGDSLLSIRILARANQAGLGISPDQFFALPTVAEQAAAIRASRPVRASAAPDTGRMPLLPIQHWFRDNVSVDRHHWNQSLLFELRRPLDLSTLEAAVQALLQHHDGLRLEPGAFDGDTLDVAPPSLSVPVTRVAVVGADPLDAMREHAVRINASLDLARAPLLRLVLFEHAAGTPSHLLVAAHHLLVDQISWQVLLEDLGAALEALAAKRAVALPPSSASIRAWARRLAEHADTSEARGELAYWQRARALPALLPGSTGDREENGEVGALRIHTSETTAALTETLLREAPARLRARPHEIVLCALAGALALWCDSRSLRLDHEGHGREAPFEQFDLSRTVGWLTCVYPLRLDLPPAGTAPTAMLSSVRDQLRAVPRGGLGHGVLRHLCSDAGTRETLADAAPSQVLFNYLGQVEAGAVARGHLGLVDAAFGTPRSLRARRPYLLDVNASIDAGRLRMQWIHNPATTSVESLERLDRAFSGELESLLHDDAVAAVSPEDFPLADLAVEDLEQLGDLLRGLDETS